MTTLTEISSRLWLILECDNDDIKVTEDFQDRCVVVAITPNAIEGSMFDQKQIEQIVEGLTPLQTPVKVTKMVSKE